MNKFVPACPTTPRADWQAQQATGLSARFPFDLPRFELILVNSATPPTYTYVTLSAVDSAAAYADGSWLAARRGLTLCTVVALA